MYHELGRDIDFKVFGITLSRALPAEIRRRRLLGTAPRRGRARHGRRRSRSFVCSPQPSPANFKALTHFKLRAEPTSTTKLLSPFSIPRLSGLSARRNPREHLGAMTAALRSQRFISDFIFPLFLSFSLSC